ncbi:MAG: hypothetical protein WDN06_17790 [Asticcacaulis sp.]
MGNTDVFINCPFSLDYNEHFWAIVYTILRSGFIPRCAREADNAGENRYAKICAIIRECGYGLHDISMTEIDPASGLPRFNMPFELGLFLGAHNFGGRRKTSVILDIAPYRYQQFLSDIAGQDIRAYDGTIPSLIEQIAGWLRMVPSHENVPGGRAIAREYETFRIHLPALCGERQLELGELTFLDFKRMATAWIEPVA